MHDAYIRAIEWTYIFFHIRSFVYVKVCARSRGDHRYAGLYKIFMNRVHRCMTHIFMNSVVIKRTKLHLYPFAFHWNLNAFLFVKFITWLFHPYFFFPSSTGWEWNCLAMCCSTMDKFANKCTCTILYYTYFKILCNSRII